MTKEKSCALALAACLLMLGACGKKDKDDEAGGEKEAATPVQVAKAEKGSIDRVVEADAVLFPITQESRSGSSGAGEQGQPGAGTGRLSDDIAGNRA